MNENNRIFWEVYGCEMNKSQANSLREYLENYGYMTSENIQNSDFIIIYTCSVRYSAEQRAYGRLHYFKYLKKTINKNLKVILLGCLGEQDKNQLIGKKLVDLVLGTINQQAVLSYLELISKNSNNFVKNLIDNEIKVEADIMSDADKDELKRNIKAEAEVRTKNGTDIKEREGKDNIKVSKERIFNNIMEETFHDYRNIEFLKSTRDPSYPFRSYVTIIHGCSNFCTYCIVPYLRGREVSRSSDEILEEIKDLKDHGVKEIILLGQNVNAYGKDNSQIPFSKLLEKIAMIDGIELISFLSSHPKDFTDDLIDVVSSFPNISKLVHLPLQSGCDKILNRMNRKYTISQYLSIVEKLKKKNENIQFSTDIIVGFPGESEEDFRETLNIINEVRFMDIFSYKYSERKRGNIQYSDDVNDGIKSERLTRLIREKERIALEIRKSQIGKTKRALIIEKSRDADDEMLVKSIDGFHGVLKLNVAAGNLVRIKIVGISGKTLICQPIEVKNAIF